MKKFLTRRRALLSGMLLIALLLVPQMTFAVESQTTSEILNKLASMLTVFSQFLALLTYPFIMLIGMLLDNEILLGPAMEGKLRIIWTEIRNWVNIAFVLGLLGVALYNVLGIGGDGSNYTLKAILPKIVIGLVLVNFSFLGVKLMIDSVAVVTNAVYALPESSNLVNWDVQKDEMRNRICKLPRENESGGTDYLTRPMETASVIGIMFCENDPGNDMLTGEFNSFGQSYFGHFGQHNVSVALMVQMGNIGNINTPQTDSGFQGASELTLALLFNLFMFVMFGFAFAALIVVLVVRIVVLWVALALSPAAVVALVFPDVVSSLGAGGDAKDKFFKHLFAPLIIGVVFSIGFVMTSALKMSTPGGWLGRIGQVDVDKLDESGALPELVATFGQDLSNLQELLIAIAAIVIIWMGTFSVAEGTVASGIVGSIKSTGETFGKWVGKLPMYATIIPVKNKDSGKVEGFNLASLGSALGLGMGARERASDEAGRKLAEQAGIIPKGTSDSQKMLTSVKGENTAKGKHSALHEGLKNKAVWDQGEDLLRAVQDIQAKSPNDAKLKTAVDAVNARNVGQALSNPSSDLSIALNENAKRNDFEYNRDEWKKSDASSGGSGATGSTAAQIAQTVKNAGGLNQSPNGGAGAARTSVSNFITNDLDVSNDAEISQLFEGGDSTQLKAALTQFKNSTDSAGKSTVLASLGDDAVDTATGKINGDAFINSLESNPLTAPAPAPAPAPTPPAGDDGN